MGLLEAARIGDDIEHSMGFLAGLIGCVLGAIVGIALVIALGPGLLVAASLIVGFAVLGRDAFSYIEKKLEIFKPLKYVPGPIAQGSPDTTIMSRQHLAARVTDKLDCHRGKVIAMGVDNITINRLAPSRQNEETQCLGKIKVKPGVTVYYSGPSKEFVKRDAEEAIPTELLFFYEALDIANLVLGILTLKSPGALAAGGSRLLHALKVADYVHSIVDVPLGIFMKAAEGNYHELWGRAFDDYRVSAATGAAAFTNSPAYTRFKEIYQVAGMLKAANGLRGTISEARVQGQQRSAAAAAARSVEPPRIDPPAAATTSAPAPVALDAPSGSTGPAPQPVRLEAGLDARIRAERLGQVELPAWHERMMGSRGD